MTLWLFAYVILPVTLVAVAGGATYWNLHRQP